MLAVSEKEWKKYGCPNCGADYWRSDPISGQGSISGTCSHCKLHYAVLAEGMKESRVLFGTGRKDENGESICEPARLLSPHPRAGEKAWRWEPDDERPDEEFSEYATSRRIGYDLAVFVKSRQAGERVIQMVKDVLGIDEPKTWLDYRERERTWIQVKFQKEEFNLNLLDSYIVSYKKITKDALIDAYVGNLNNDRVWSDNEIKYFKNYAERHGMSIDKILKNRKSKYPELVTQEKW